MSLAMSALPVPPLPLQSPLTAYFNVLGISRGKTVPSEVLGSGDATVTGQAFTLAKTPLTYFASGDGVVSTLAVRVNGRLWREAKSFYQQPADAQIFVTDEDENQVTHVQFGDGVNGARLPTGSNNVVATYRYGSGAKSPLSGEITVIDKPWPNLKSVKNPVAVGGGADPDPPDQVRKYAPLSVMTFGRAISGDDYQAIAARAPGVTRVQAVWSFDGTEQRGAMTLYVGDTPAAAASATTAIAAAGDPHRHVVVVQATPVPVAVVLLVLVDPAYDPAIVAAAVRAAFLDPDTGLFGANRLGVGDAIFHSAMSAACINCEGALALRGTAVVAYDIAAQSIVLLPGPRFDPGEGAFFNLDPNWLFVLAGVDPA
jgi:predicted phage baseplate assembly protein